MSGKNVDLSAFDINSMKNKQMSQTAVSFETFQLVQAYFKQYLEDILGLRSENMNENGKLDGILELLIDIRKEAKTKKDYSTSDRIRKHLQQLGILLKDEKDGSMSYTFE